MVWKTLNRSLAKEHKHYTPSSSSTAPLPIRLESGVRFLKGPRKLTFRARSHSKTLRLQSCFIHVFLICAEVPFMQEVSGAYTSPFLDTDELKMALRARNVSGVFEKRALGPLHPETRAEQSKNQTYCYLCDPSITNVNKWIMQCSNQVVKKYWKGLHH